MVGRAKCLDTSDHASSASLADVRRSGADLLRGALLDSRQRWRDLVCMAADFAFETDAEGRIVFAAPERVLGWPAEGLIGCKAASLLATPGGFDPFASGAAFRDQKVWLNRAEGGVSCLRFAAAPLLDAGQPAGMRGVAQDVTAQDAHDAQVAAALRRGEVMDHILRQMRQEVLAPRMMQAVLEGLVAALGGDGAAVLNLLVEAGPDSLIHHTGSDAGAILPILLGTMAAEAQDPVTLVVDGWPILACPSYTRFGERAGLCVWRPRNGPAWTEDDAHLASSATTIVRVVLEHEAIQRELARQARTDPLTGLLNRRFFLEEANRRIDRLDREGLPGTLIYVDLDNFKPLNDACGHYVGDVALVQMAKLLRNTVRPADLVARLGGDEFALWLDGSDELTAAERAESLRLHGPAALAEHLPAGAPALTTSIGIAARHPRAGEALEDVMRRADAAMYEVKRAGRAQWRVSRDPLLS